MEFLLLGALMGLLPAVIAGRKGRAFGPWWVFGALVFIVALPASLFIESDAKALEAADLYTGRKKKCPECAAILKAEANDCPSCRRGFSREQRVASGV